jgi:hypothetical protein
LSEAVGNMRVVEPTCTSDELSQFTIHQALYAYVLPIRVQKVAKNSLTCCRAAASGAELPPPKM